jgi:hypothetical protein
MYDYDDIVASKLHVEDRACQIEFRASSIVQALHTRETKQAWTSESRIVETRCQYLGSLVGRDPSFITESAAK